MSTRDNRLVLPSLGAPQGIVNTTPLAWGGDVFAVVKWGGSDQFVSSNDVAWLRATAAAFTQAAGQLEQAQAQDAGGEA